LLSSLTWKKSLRTDIKIQTEDLRRFCGIREQVRRDSDLCLRLNLWKLQHSAVGNTAASWSKRRGFIYLAPGLCSQTIWRKGNLVLLGDEIQHAFHKPQSEITVHGLSSPLLTSTALLISDKKLEKSREAKKNKAETPVTAVFSAFLPWQHFV